MQKQEALKIVLNMATQIKAHKTGTANSDKEAKAIQIVEQMIQDSNWQF